MKIRKTKCRILAYERRQTREQNATYHNAIYGILKWPWYIDTNEMHTCRPLYRIRKHTPGGCFFLFFSIFAIRNKTVNHDRTSRDNPETEASWIPPNNGRNHGSAAATSGERPAQLICKTYKLRTLHKRKRRSRRTLWHGKYIQPHCTWSAAVLQPYVRGTRRHAGTREIGNIRSQPHHTDYEQAP